MTKLGIPSGPLNFETLYFVQTSRVLNDWARSLPEMIVPFLMILMLLGVNFFFPDIWLIQFRQFLEPREFKCFEVYLYNKIVFLYHTR